MKLHGFYLDKQQVPLLMLWRLIPDSLLLRAWLYEIGDDVLFKKLMGEKDPRTKGRTMKGSPVKDFMVRTAKLSARLRKEDRSDAKTAPAVMMRFKHYPPFLLHALANPAMTHWLPKDVQEEIKVLMQARDLDEAASKALNLLVQWMKDHHMDVPKP